MTIENSPARVRTEAVPVTTPDKKRTRPGVREFGTNSGPLAFIMKLKLEGHRLYFANDKSHNDPFFIQRLLDPTVGWDYVHPSEVGITEINGVQMTDKVTMPVGGGAVGYLLKQPIEWAEEDLAAKKKFNQKSLYKEDSHLDRIPGAIGESRQFDITSRRK